MFKNETWVTFLHIYRVTSVVTDSNFFLWFFNHDIGNCKIEKLMYFPTSEFLITKVCKYSAHYASVKSLKPQLIASKIQASISMSMNIEIESGITSPSWGFVHELIMPWAVNYSSRVKPKTMEVSALDVMWDYGFNSKREKPCY